MKDLYYDSDCIDGEKNHKHEFLWFECLFSSNFAGIYWEWYTEKNYQYPCVI